MIREGLASLVLGQRLGQPIRKLSPRPLIAGLALEHRIVLVDACEAGVAVDRLGRHEEVAADLALKDLGGVPYPLGDAGRDVEYGVPLPALERPEVVLAVTDDARPRGTAPGSCARG